MGRTSTRGAEQKRSRRVKRRRPEGARIRRILLSAFNAMLTLCVLGFVSAVFVTAYHYLVTTPFLKLQRVEMSGIDARSMHELVDRCGLNSNISLLSIRLDALKAEMEKHPWVRSVNLERRFPHTLMVTVERQEPAALVVDGGLFYLNRHGEVFKPLEASEPADFPVITGVGDDPKQRKAQLRAAVRILQLLKEESSPWSVKELGEIHVRDGGGTSLYFRHMAAEIRMSEGELKDKIRGLRRVARHLETTGRISRVTGIDLDYRDGAVVTFDTG